MKEKLIGLILQHLLTLLTPEVLKEVIDDLLDRIEDKAADTSNPIDDVAVSAIVGTIRTAFNIPDDIGGDTD